MKFLTLLAVWMCALMCSAQNPDLFPLVDLRPTISSERGGPSQLKWYDAMGRYSTVGLRLNLEPGLRAVVLERLQKIPGDADREQLDICFIENPGQWRAGRLYLPIGAQQMIRECVLAIQANTRLLIDDLPIAIAICDAGKGRQRGVAARIGKRLGFSFALGNHFGIAASSFAATRGASNSPGAGSGYQFVLGLDYAKRINDVRFSLEGFALREGERIQDHNEEVTDAQITADLFSGKLQIGAAWSREWSRKADYVRIFGVMRLGEKFAVEPMFRTRRGGFRDFSVTLSARL